MPASASLYLGKQTVRAHVEQALVEIIQPDEVLMGAFHGQALSAKGYGLTAKYKGGFSLHDYLLLTDQRVILWVRGIFSRSTDGFYYEDIISVEEAVGLLLGEIVLNVRGAKERMRSMVKSDVPLAARMIREQVSNARRPRRPPAVPSPPQLIYLVYDGQQTGPFEAAEIGRAFSSGNLASDTLGWQEGIPDWQPLSQILQLPSQTPPPLPAPTAPPSAEFPPSIYSPTLGQAPVPLAAPAPATSLTPGSPLTV